MSRIRKQLRSGLVQSFPFNNLQYVAMRTTIQHILAPCPGCPGGPGCPGNPTPGSPLGPEKYRHMLNCKLVSVIA